MAMVKHDGEIKMGLLQAAYGMPCVFYVSRRIESHYLIRRRCSYSTSICDTVCSDVPLVFPLSHIFDSIDVKLYIFSVRLPIKKTRWWVTCKYSLFDEVNMPIKDCLKEAGEIVPDHVENTSGDSKYTQMLRVRAVHLLALFLILYIGVEVTIGGQLINDLFLIEQD